jgi:lipopolysaccharide assembly outer membrane protein LptD (OstA)
MNWPCFLCGLLVFCCTLYPVYGQESNTESKLFQETLPLQISTATFTELSDWCKELGLSAQGTRKELEQRLYEYYKLPTKITSEETKGEETFVQIQSATSTEYFTLEEFDEEYVRLDGGVHLVMEDKKKGNTYTLRADSVLYNRSKKLLSAYGNIRYEIKSQTQEEKFTGNSILINLDTWEGYFLQGQSLREQDVAGEVLTFRFEGEFISRSSSDFILMEDAMITSSPAIPANYRIEGDKIWILGPREWGIQNAALYVGNIPVLYLPFFFYPGDEVMFHPVFGYRSREGTFLQTTTYLMGNRKRETGSGSFLQISEEGANDRVKQRHGIFLRDTEEKLAQPDWYIKAMLDVYTRLGVYGGIEGSLPELFPDVEKFYFSGGIGISRNLYLESVSGYGSLYTPYYEKPDGTFSTFWNTTYMGGIQLPFRYGSEISFEYNPKPLNLQFKMENYSDPYFTYDFEEREEKIDWSRLLEEGFIEETTRELKEQLDWYLTGSYTASTTLLSPWVTSLSIPKFRVSLNWKSKETPSSILEDYEKVDPTRRFYYPYQLTAPEVSANVGGTLYRYSSQIVSSKTSSASAPSGAPSSGVRPPWEEETPPETSQDEGFALKEPDLLPDKSGISFPTPVDFELRYALRPNLIYQGNSYPDDWVNPKDVEYKLSYSTITFQNQAQLISDLRLYGKLLQQQNTLSLSTQYRDVDFWDNAVPEAQRNSLKLTAYQYNSVGVSDLYTLTSYPLVNTDLFQNSTVKYSVNAYLYKHNFSYLDGDDPVYKGQYLDFSKQTVTQHWTQLNLVADFSVMKPTVQFSYTLPPLDEVFFSSASLAWGPSTTSVGFTLKKIESQWVQQPLSVQEQLRFSNEVSFTASYLHDLEEEHPSSLSLIANLWYFRLEYKARYTEPYQYEGPSSGWVKQEEKQFIPSDLSLGVSYRYEPDPLWKNRIRISTGINTTWNMSLIQFTESALSFTYDLTFSIYRFLDLKLSTTSKNTMMYQYIPSLAEEVDRTWRNPLVDLLKSFNFLHTKDRYESYFKLTSISLEAIHHLDDWDLTISYTGTPELLTRANGRQEFRWNGIFGIFLQWKPIPAIKSEFRYDESGLTY